MKIKRFALQMGVIVGVILGVKYVFPVMLPFLMGWILSEGIHPLARFLANRKWSRRLHIKESGIGTFFILIFAVLGIWIFLIGIEYLTGKIGECIKFYPQIKAEAEEIVGRCCQGVEQITGIQSADSKEYIFRQAEKFQKELLEGRFSMEQTANSVKKCAIILGVFIIGIVSSILFLQERKKIREILKKSSFYQKIEKIGRELLKGVKGYLKAQVKITGLICGLCVAGFWVLKIRYFLGLGLLVGVLDALPVLGTGFFLIPAGLLLLFQGEIFTGVGLFLLYLVTAGVRQILEPRLVGNSVGLSPLLILFSVYLGLIVYGGFGFFLGPLSALILYEIFKEWKLFLT